MIFTPVKKFLGVCCLSLLSSVAYASTDAGTDSDQCIPHNAVVLPGSDRSISHVDLIHRVKDEPVVLLGEYHDNIEHHRWQLQMISGLYTLNRNLVLGFEMFPREVQPVLDQWVAGELSEKEFLKAAKWAEYWRFDKDLYVDLFHFARMNSIPMVALNVDRGLIRKVGKKGWDNIPVEEREGVGKAKAASQGYREMLAGVFMRHDTTHDSKEAPTDFEAAIKKILESPGFNRFVESQSAWDRAMAEGIAAGAGLREGAQVVAVMGSGHMMSNFGVPEQLQDLGYAKPAVLIPWDTEFKCEFVSADFADAIIGLRTLRWSQVTKKNHPRLGVYLDQTDKGVAITGVVDGSIAEKLQMKEGDIIVDMAGKPVSTVEEVIKTVKATQFGTWLPFTVLRGDKERVDMVAKFPTEESGE